MQMFPPAVHQCRLYAMSIVAVLALTFCLTPAASLAAPLLWSAPAQIDGLPLAGVSCPTTGFCVAVDSSGNVLTSTNPTGGASAWTKATVDAGGGGGASKGVFCLSASFCVVVDGGDVVTSTNPAGGSAAWTVTTIGSEYVGFTGIACASTSLCVTGDAFGDLVASTNPTGGASEWHSVLTASEVDYFDSVSCPSEALCVAADSFSGFATSTTPASGMTWHFTGQIEGATASVSCPSVSFCVGVGGGRVAISTNPTGGASAWHTTLVDSGTMTNVSCPSTAMCAAVDKSGNVVEMAPSEPEGVGSSAHSIDGTTSLTGVSCPSEELCLGVDSKGNVLVGKPAVEEEHSGGGGQNNGGGSTGGGSSAGGSPPTNNQGGGIGAVTSPSISPAQIVASLAQQLAPSGKSAKIGALLKYGGLTMAFKALEAGTLSVGWYLVPVGAKLARKTKARPVLVASGKLAFSAAGAGKLKLKLTSAGTHMLKHAKQLKLMVKGTFTPSGGATAEAAGTFVLKR